MKRLFLAGIIALINTPVFGEWLEVYVDAEAEQTVYVDPGTIRHKGDLAEMWALYNYKKAQQRTGRDSYMSRKVLVEFNCIMERRRMLAVTEYSDNMGAGKVIYSKKTSPFSPEPMWARVQPGVAETLMKFACTKQ